jgi:hypothetical protein
MFKNLSCRSDYRYKEIDHKLHFRNSLFLVEGGGEASKHESRQQSLWCKEKLVEV